MDFELNEQQLAFQRAARDFARDEMAPRAAEWDAQAIFPRDTLRHAGELGFCGLYAPESAGGLGLPRLDATIVLEELAAACPSTTAFLSIHNMATWMVCSQGSPELVRRFGPSLCSGERLASYCLTEPGAGSDAASLRTTARRVGTGTGTGTGNADADADGDGDGDGNGDDDGDAYVIDGTKAFISGAGSTDVLVVMARTGGAGADGISAFLVPGDAPGIQYGRKEEKMGWNSQPTRAIAFDGVRVPASHRLGEEGRGFRIAMQGLDGGRINIATCSVGAAQGALGAAQRYMHERRQFGRALADMQALQFKLADMATELVAARQMVRLAASKLDAGSPDAQVYCAMAKRLATDIGFSVCNEALQIHGGYGYIREYPLERYLRDARVHQILEGTNEIMRVIVARRMLQDHAPEAIR